MLFEKIRGYKEYSSDPICEVNALAMPIELAKALDVNTNIVSVEFGTVSDGVFTRTSKDKATHCIQMKQEFTTTVKQGSSITVHVGPYATDMLKDHTNSSHLITFYCDEEGVVYTTLKNGSRYYMEKKRLEMKKEA